MTQRKPSGRSTRERSARIKRRQIREFGYLRCHLCGQEIDPGAKFPDPRSWSIDHLIPIAQGGADHDDNCDGAHLACNQRKGDGTTTNRTTPERPRCVPVADGQRLDTFGGWSKAPCATHPGRWIAYDEHGQMHDGFRHPSVDW
jgi:5-methylcytosine-specific restriction endonuclease McrA